jgi:hypothetical protein
VRGERAADLAWTCLDASLTGRSLLPDSLLSTGARAYGRDRFESWNVHRSMRECDDILFSSGSHDGTCLLYPLKGTSRVPSPVWCGFPAEFIPLAYLSLSPLLVYASYDDDDEKWHSSVLFSLLPLRSHLRWPLPPLALRFTR